MPVGLVDRVIAALSGNDAVVPTLEVADALWSAAGGSAEHPVASKSVFRVQTPQGFKLDATVDTYRHCGKSAADDAAIAAAAGIRVQIVNGSEKNIRLTRREAGGV